MPTYAELQQEEVWRTQVVPPRLATLGANVEAHYDAGVVNVGMYGDYRHLKGYHRSRNWILGSRYCTNRAYSVTETVGNRTGDSGDFISGIDIVVGYQRSLAIWERVNVARQRGIITHLRQVLLERSPWHVHLSIDRAYANADHTRLFHVITGQPLGREAHVNFDVELPVLRQGSEGSDVVTAQALLVARGHNTNIDGEFGPNTHANTIDMQRHFGAESVDGIWGPETWTIAITGEDRR